MFRKKARPAEKIGRRRRVAGASLLVLGAVAAGVWFISRWYVCEFRLGTTEREYGVVHGALVVEWWPDHLQLSFPRSPWMFDLRRLPRIADAALFDRWCWRSSSLIRERSPRLQVVDVYVVTYAGYPDDPVRLVVVLWPIPLVLLFAGGLLLRWGVVTRRRVWRNGCAKCGYSLTGLSGGVPCPECGRLAV